MSTQKSVFDSFTNKYSLSKTIRFLLKPVDYTLPEQNENIFEILKFFSEDYCNVIENFDKLIFSNSELSSKLEIKHGWLKTYTKSEFYEAKNNIIKINNGRKQSNKISINEPSVFFLKEYFENWNRENKECVEALNAFLITPEENQKRRSEAAFWLAKISKRSNFEFIFDLFNKNIDHKTENKDISAIFNNLQNCKLNLVTLIDAFRPSQSFGVEIERASLNYYTVNKKPKDYPEEIQKKTQGLQTQYSFKEEEGKLLTSVGFSDINLQLGDLKEAMKQFKAKQKSAFYEFVSKNGQFKDLKINNDLKLLKDITEENFNKFKDTSTKQYKGKFFQLAKHHFPNYYDFCNLYKKVAIKYGNINSEIKALEKEAVDAQKLKSWAIIAEHTNQKYVILIPGNAQNNLPDAKKYIDSLTDTVSETWKLFVFESLTLRGLDKLCFGFDKNTFMVTDSVVYKELQKKHNTYFENGKLKRKDQFSKDGKELIKFYQEVLSLDATKAVLAIDNFDGLSKILERVYESIESFEMDLKECCYYKREVSFSEDVKNHLIKTFSAKIYQIISYDLEKERNNPEQHTKIWRDFWTSNNSASKYSIRLNPELKISFVEARPDELEGRKLGKLKKNRRNEKQFLLSTTIFLNAHGKNVDLSFKTEVEVEKFFGEFNQKFNEGRKPFEHYYYGLDRGQKELLTLGVFKFSEEEKVTYTKNDGSNSQYQKPEFIDLEVYEIKTDKLTHQNEKGRVAYKTPDQFIDNEAVMEKITASSCLDLSCAKLIKGKIVVNGDIATYLALKIVSAKRKIYEGVTRGEFTSDRIGFNADKKSFFLKYKNKGETKDIDLYFWDLDFSAIVTQDQIKHELQTYHDEVKSKKNYELVTIEKVNHLRDAICANAVGIMHHLYAKFPGIFIFEDIKNAQKEKHSTQFAGNLASRIEQKILQKFQTAGLVPPALKQIMSRQSKNEISQLGCVLYVKTEGTSSECPHCETKNTDKTEKWGAHAYVCSNENCGFDSKEIQKRKGLNALDNSDNVATYTIAKRGLGLINKFTQS